MINKAYSSGRESIYTQITGLGRTPKKEVFGEIIWKTVPKSKGI